MFSKAETGPGWQGPKCLSHLLLPPGAQVGRRLELWVELRLKLRYSHTKCRHLKWYLNHAVTPRVTAYKAGLDHALAQSKHSKMPFLSNSWLLYSGLDWALWSPSVNQPYAFPAPACQDRPSTLCPHGLCTCYWCSLDSLFFPLGLCSCPWINRPWLPHLSLSKSWTSADLSTGFCAY